MEGRKEDKVEEVVRKKDVTKEEHKQINKKDLRKDAAEEEVVTGEEESLQEKRVYNRRGTMIRKHANNKLCELEFKSHYNFNKMSQSQWLNCHICHKIKLLFLFIFSTYLPVFLLKF